MSLLKISEEHQGAASARQVGNSVKHWLLQQLSQVSAEGGHTGSHCTVRLGHSSACVITRSAGSKTVCEQGADDHLLRSDCTGHSDPGWADTAALNGT